MDEQNAQASIDTTPAPTADRVIPDTEVDAEQPAGVPDGEVLKTTTHDGKVVSEKVVNDLDEDGNIIGWHKETV